MKKYLFLLVLIGSIAGLAMAASVTTKDGKTFHVTNDLGISADYSMEDINTIADDTKRSMQKQQQSLVVASEVYYSWAGAQQLALNALSGWQSMQVNAVDNATVNAVDSTTVNATPVPSGVNWNDISSL